MWNAIKSDLLDFVSTIKDDTTKTLINVLGEDEEVNLITPIVYTGTAFICTNKSYDLLGRQCGNHSQKDAR